ncbi:1-acyl-sn-glycerol-3-phosphate acyltransferase [Mechercharimyces sp. CAU 1602]|uniref:lysophospholipid acyltransferase family protein n=1 Tax=Mechercharimyces sp. CAU 1602 TaxID=2973933 RepID=UPI0021639B46|nr:lysophospholipid acyltransferase family protein [Mechercharimyces sp. CAU 1602]MCS1350963.1 1-acyl-sn-glycerol-3-phosphate acyltransferase [Mechercharimyces sp. CAU 1602]
MLYQVLGYFMRPLFAVLFRWEVEGFENIPEKDPVVFCSNHFSNWDPPVIGAAGRRTLAIMAKKELLDIPVVGQILQALGAFPVQRGLGDNQAIQLAVAELHKGKSLLIFPEGTRSKTGELGRARPGVIIIAESAGLPIVPIAIVGPYHPFKKIRVIFGAPIDVKHDPAYVQLDARAKAQKVMDQIATTIEQKKIM